MYESHFGLENRPFLAAPVAHRYFAAASIEEARRNLLRAIQRSEGPGLVIGPAGVGKSQLCQVLAEQCREEFAVAMLSSARLCTRRALLQAIFHGVGLPFREREEGELRLSLIDYLDELPAGKQGMLLIVDEAHALPLRLLEEIRMITNMVRSGVATVRLVLAGLPTLEERFASPKLDSLNQRIAARCYLQPFESNETHQYIRAQLAVCGTKTDRLVTDDGLQAIHHATGGIPRLINQVCDHALVLACAAGVAAIDAAVVEEAWGDLQQLPVPWSPHAELQQDSDEHGVVEFGTFDDEIADGADLDLDDESDVASLRFPESQTDRASARLDEIEGRLAELDDEFQPAGVIRPEVELVFPEPSNPFEESFESEEVVLDQYAALDESIWKGRPRVTNRGGDGFSQLEAGPKEKVAVQLVTQAEDELDEQLDSLADEENPPTKEIPLEDDYTIEANGEYPVLEIEEPTPDLATAAQQLSAQLDARLDAAPTDYETEADDETSIDSAIGQSIDVVMEPEDEVPSDEASISLDKAMAAVDPVLPESWDSETTPIAATTPEQSIDAPSWFETESDVIVIDDEDDQPSQAAVPAPKIQRREYRQLFARLRQG